MKLIKIEIKAKNLISKELSQILFKRIAYINTSSGFWKNVKMNNSSSQNYRLRETVVILMKIHWITGFKHVKGCHLAIQCKNIMIKKREFLYDNAFLSLVMIYFQSFHQTGQRIWF